MALNRNMNRLLFDICEKHASNARKTRVTYDDIYEAINADLYELLENNIKAIYAVTDHPNKTNLYTVISHLHTTIHLNALYDDEYVKSLLDLIQIQDPSGEWIKTVRIEINQSLNIAMRAFVDMGIKIRIDESRLYITNDMCDRIVLAYMNATGKFIPKPTILNPTLEITPKTGINGLFVDVSWTMKNYPEHKIRIIDGGIRAAATKSLRDAFIHAICLSPVESKSEMINAIGYFVLEDMMNPDKMCDILGSAMTSTPLWYQQIISAVNNELDTVIINLCGLDVESGEIKKLVSERDHCSMLEALIK